MLADLLFYLVVAALIAHEMDAVYQREWRLLYVLRRLPEDQARHIFVLAHVPVGVAIFGLITYPDASVRFVTMVGLDLFAVVHAGLHARLRRHPLHTFGAPPSLLLIYGAALVAVGHGLLLTLR